MLQRHYSGGFRMAAASFGVVRSVFLISLLAQGRTRRRLHEVEKVISRGPSGVVLSVFDVPIRLDSAVLWRQIVWLVLMSQSN